MNIYYGVIKRENNNRYNDFTINIGEQISEKIPENTLITCADYTEEITWFAEIVDTVIYTCELRDARLEPQF